MAVSRKPLNPAQDESPHQPRMKILLYNSGQQTSGAAKPDH
jgi:hypothetical protein